MKIIKLIPVALVFLLVVFFLYFNNVNRVNPKIANYYTELKVFLKRKGYSDNLLVITTKRTKWENKLLEKYSVAAPNSKHLTGEAIDFLVMDINSDNRIDSVDVDIVYDILDKEIIKDKGGIGTYLNQGLITSQMIHVDCRDNRARWKN